MSVVLSIGCMYSSVLCASGVGTTFAEKKERLLRPGIEPGSSACEALVLTDIRTELLT
jgi:hypothetical protein